MRAAIHHELASYGRPTQLVLDGAIVRDIHEHMREFRLTGKPLFRETADMEIVRAGPWLISPPQDEDALARCVAAAQSAGKGVFWLGQHEPDALYRHLRRLNAASMPDGQVLYFRHYDSDVLASIVTLLNAEQAAPRCGPSNMIAFIGGRGDGASVSKPDALPDAKCPPIAFESWQIDQLNIRQKEITRKLMSDSARLDLARIGKQLDEKELQRSILKYEESGASHGLRSPRALSAWTRLNIETNNDALESQSLRFELAKIPDPLREEVFVYITPQLISAYQEKLRR